MHKKPPRNPYEPSVRERLTQREAAVRIQAYVCTGKRKYAVSKPLTTTEINSLWSSDHSVFYQPNGNGVVYTHSQPSSRYIIIDYENWGPAKNIEERWLTERQATMLRLKGFSVDYIL